MALADGRHVCTGFSSSWPLVVGGLLHVWGFTRHAIGGNWRQPLMDVLCTCLHACVVLTSAHLYVCRFCCIWTLFLGAEYTVCYSANIALYCRHLWQYYFHGMQIGTIAQNSWTVKTFERSTPVSFTLQDNPTLIPFFIAMFYFFHSALGSLLSGEGHCLKSSTSLLPMPFSSPFFFLSEFPLFCLKKKPQQNKKLISSLFELLFRFFPFYCWEEARVISFFFLMFTAFCPILKGSYG